MLTHSIRTPIFRAKLVLVVVAGALLAIALFAGKAQALGTCPYTGAEQIFKPWGDVHHYVLAPDGAFEDGGNGWALRNGAATVEGNESYYLNDASDSSSLSLPSDSAAVSPAICMSVDTPVLRFVARNTGNPSSRLRVEAKYELLGVLRTNVVNDLKAGPSWSPSKELDVTLGLSTIMGTIVPSSIKLHFTPLDNRGEWQIDDFYVDPFARR